MTEVTLNERNEMLMLMSDLSKEAYGFRSRKDYTGASDEEILSDWNHYITMADDRQREEERQEALAWEDFKSSLQRVAELANVSMGTALRWDLEAYDVKVSSEPGYSPYDLGFYCYKRGFAYRSEQILEALLEDNVCLL